MHIIQEWVRSRAYQKLNARLHLAIENGRHEDYDGLPSQQPKRLSLGWLRSQKFLCNSPWISWCFKVCAWVTQVCKSNCSLGDAYDSNHAKEKLLRVQVFGLWRSEHSSHWRLLYVYNLRLYKTPIFCIHWVENSMDLRGLWDTLRMLWSRRNIQ